MTGPAVTPESLAGQAPALPDSYTPLHGHPEYRIVRYDLHLDYRVRTNRLAGHATLTGQAVQDLTEIRVDLAGLRAEKVNVNGTRARSFRQAGTELIIRPSAPVPPGTELTVDIRYGGYPGPLRGNWGEVGWEELTDGVLVAGQPTGAPSWFPCNDHPSQKASFGFTVTTDPGYYLVCNGRLVSRHAKAGRQTWVYEQAEPMATYLATVQIGRYAHEAIPPATAPGQDKPPAVQQFVAAPPALMGRARQGLSQQPLMLQTFERCFGPYPFSGYTVVVPQDELEIPLEAQSLSIIGPNHLDSGWDSQRLIAHELAHQWFGNSLTCRSWNDIWLHEGFACYAEWIWSEASGSLSAHERALAAHRLLSARDQDLVIGDPGPEWMFDDRVYKRGALALHALRRASGDRLFFEFLRTWTAENRFGTVTTIDFVTAADRVCGSIPGFDAARILNPWLYRNELPLLHT